MTYLKNNRISLILIALFSNFLLIALPYYLVYNRIGAIVFENYIIYITGGFLLFILLLGFILNFSLHIKKTDTYYYCFLGAMLILFIKIVIIYSTARHAISNTIDKDIIYQDNILSIEWLWSYEELKRKIVPLYHLYNGVSRGVPEVAKKLIMENVKDVATLIVKVKEYIELENLELEKLREYKLDDRKRFIKSIAVVVVLTIGVLFYEFVYPGPRTDNNADNIANIIYPEYYNYEIIYGIITKSLTSTLDLLINLIL